MEWLGKKLDVLPTSMRRIHDSKCKVDPPRGGSMMAQKAQIEKGEN
jgi:hypothetical protein